MIFLQEILCMVYLNKQEYFFISFYSENFKFSTSKTFLAFHNWGILIPFTNYSQSPKVNSYDNDFLDLLPF